MKKLKMYVNTKDLNEYEQKNNKISFRRLIDRLFTDMILCNDIVKLFYAELNEEYIEPEFIVGSDYNEEYEENIDVYQYFIVDFNSYTYEHILKKYAEQLGNEIILYYIEELDLYVLGVTHFGTGWDYVLTDIEPTDNINNSDF